MAKDLDPKKLQMLSPDNDGWNKLVSDYNYNEENTICGVLLYPRTGISKKRAESEIQEWIESQHAVQHGSVETTCTQRKEYWAVAYKIGAWYNHFNLSENFDD